MLIREFGHLNGRPVPAYTIRSNGFEAEILGMGAILRTLKVPYKSGARDVVLGYDFLEPYIEDPHYHGAVVGRVCNRIAQGRFVLDGMTYQLERNLGPHHLHGGSEGFTRQIWSMDADRTRDNCLVMNYISEHMEAGYPGRLKAEVEYTLDGDSLTVTFRADTDQKTLCNLTQHAYFNLDGSRDILDHRLKINAGKYTETDADQIPNGNIAPVKNTPLDFGEFTRIGEQINTAYEPLEIGKGYDHNFILDQNGDESVPAARLESPAGQGMEIHTTEPGIQLYTGNHLGNEKGKNDFVHIPRSGVCLETQHYPDAPNHPEFPTIVLEPGEEFFSQTKFRFYE